MPSRHRPDRPIPSRNTRALRLVPARVMLSFRWEETMNQDELKGKAEQVKGKVKQAFGDLTDDEKLHSEGTADEVRGNVREGFGTARRKVGETIEDIGESLKK